jgi:hypothetical protein
LSTYARHSKLSRPYRVLTSNDAVLADPLTEVHQVADEFAYKMWSAEPSRKLTQEDVEKFDPNLQHNTKTRVQRKAKRNIIYGRERFWK